MTPRYADIRWSLIKYPEISSAERRALWRWYKHAGASELMAALCDPQVEKKLERLRQDYPDVSWTAAFEIVAIIGAIAGAGLLALWLG